MFSRVRHSAANSTSSTAPVIAVRRSLPAGRRAGPAPHGFAFPAWSPPHARHRPPAADMEITAVFRAGLGTPWTCTSTGRPEAITSSPWLRWSAAARVGHFRIWHVAALGCTGSTTEPRSTAISPGLDVPTVRLRPPSPQGRHRPRLPCPQAPPGAGSHLLLDVLIAPLPGAHEADQQPDSQGAAVQDQQRLIPDSE